MDEVQCTGDEEFIANCPFDGWGSHDCSHYEDAGVVCEGRGRGLSGHVTSVATSLNVM